VCSAFAPPEAIQGNSSTITSTITIIDHKQNHTTLCESAVKQLKVSYDINFVDGVINTDTPHNGPRLSINQSVNIRLMRGVSKRKPVASLGGKGGGTAPGDTRMQ